MKKKTNYTTSTLTQVVLQYVHQNSSLMLLRLVLLFKRLLTTENESQVLYSLEEDKRLWAGSFSTALTSSPHI